MPMVQFERNIIKDRRKRPSRGIVIFSSVIILFSFISFLSIIISFFQLRLELQIRDNMPILFTQIPNVTINFTIFWLSTVVSLLIMFCWIISGVGMLILKEWARQLLLISLGVYFLNKPIEIFITISLVREHSAQIPFISLCVGIVLVLAFAISISYFFTHPNVVKQFKPNLKSFH